MVLMLLMEAWHTKFLPNSDALFFQQVVQLSGINIRGVIEGERG